MQASFRHVPSAASARAPLALWRLSSGPLLSPRRRSPDHRHDPSIGLGTRAVSDFGTPRVLRQRGLSRPMLALAFVVAGMSCGSVLAQPARVEVSKNDDLRAAFANTADIADGGRIAAASCAACHGAGGLSTVAGTPHLAGQRPGYLYAELRAYQSGARTGTVMNEVVRPLADAAMVKVSAYFASLEPAQPAAAAKPVPARPDTVQAGKAAAAACAGCHGETGVSSMPGTPSLAGLDPKYVVTTMKAYKADQRKSDVMKPMVAGLSDADLANLALFYALQKPARAPTKAAGDPAAGKTASAGCAGCHGATGVSATAANPSLAGQDAEYFIVALQAYKNGTRSDDTMKGMAAALDDAGIKNLAAFYATQQPQAPNVRKPLTTAEWAQRCDRCHGPTGNSTDPRLPALAGQRQDYLAPVLHAYRTGARKSAQMSAMASGLSESDVEDLASYYARQKARTPVYVAVPAK